VTVRAPLTLSLRTGLVIGAVLAVLITALSVHLPWNYTSRRHVAELTREFNLRVIEAVSGEIDAMLEGAIAARNGMLTTLRAPPEQGGLNPRDADRRDLTFLATLQGHPSVSAIEVGWPDGSSVLARRTTHGIYTFQDNRAGRDGQPGSVSLNVYAELDDGSLQVLSRGEQVAAHYSVADQLWYKLAFIDDGEQWTNIYRSPLSRQLGVSTYAPIDPSNPGRGTLGVTIELSRLNSFINAINLPHKGTIFLTNFARELVAVRGADINAVSNPQNDAFLGKIDDSLDPLIIAACEGLGEQGIVLGKLAEASQISVADALGGEGYLISLAPLPQMGLVAVVVLSAEDVLGGIARDTRLLMAGLAVLILLVALVTALVARHWLGNPLVAITRKLRRIEALEFGGMQPVPSRLRELRTLDDALHRMGTSLASFSRYVPIELVRDMVSQGIPAELGGERRDMTLLFADLAGFTSITERLGDEVVPFLAGFLDAASQAVQTEHGTIDKFMGDAVMAFWGAPVPRTNHALLACRAALKLRDLVVALDTDYRAKGLPGIDARVGLNTGQAVVGNVGSRSRLNYTALGDIVNVASRLEGLNKLYGTHILIGEHTRAQAGVHIHARLVDYVAVKGKQQGEAVFELLGLADAGDSGREAEPWLTAYAAGLAAYRAGDWADAEIHFTRADHLRVGGDAPAIQMRARCQHFSHHPPDAHWDGLMHALDK
jgi:adenylate cyclase